MHDVKEIAPLKTVLFVIIFVGFWLENPKRSVGSVLYKLFIGKIPVFLLVEHSMNSLFVANLLTTYPLVI